MFLAVLTVVCIGTAVNANYIKKDVSLESLAKELSSLRENYVTQVASLQHQVSQLQQKLDKKLSTGTEGLTVIMKQQYSIDSNAPIPFNEVVTSIPGTVFNTTSGEFTCTFGGYYWVSATVYLVSTTTTLTPQIVMNFVEQASSYAYQIGTSTGSSLTVSGLVNCPIGQKIWVRAAENGAVVGTPINSSSSFSIIKMI